MSKKGEKVARMDNVRWIKFLRCKVDIISRM